MTLTEDERAYLLFVTDGWREMPDMTSPTPPPYKALREALGLSQRAVERELGWSTGRLSVIERGLVPSEEERRQLLAFLNDRLTEEVTR